MKLAGRWALAFAASLLAGPAGASRWLRQPRRGGPSEDSSKRTITKVINLLETMLESSQAEGVKEKELFAKHKCYCDSNEEEKSATATRLTEEIGILQSRIESTQASTAILGQETAELAKNIEETQEELNTATTLRNDQNAAFLTKEADLKNAIGQMEAALQVLSSVGADQSLGEDASHTQFMARQNEAQLLALKRVVKQALVAASAFDARPKQEKTLDAFLQAPFTGTYASQSGEVVGILKQMMETFTANLDQAMEQEAVELAAYAKLNTTLKEAEAAMTDSLSEKQGLLSANDGSLGTMKEQLSTAELELGDTTTFLQSLEEMCTTKAQEYEKRVQLRAGEEAAISQAIAILNSDAAFATFGKVAATSTGGTGPSAFVQLASARSPAVTDSGSQRRQQASALLRKAAHGHRSTVLSRVVGLLEAGNPFKTVLEEIGKMISVIDDEEKADQEKFDWCEEETFTKESDKADAENQIMILKTQISDLNTAIQDPETGLIVTIKNTEESLATNRESQKSETETRTKENLVYQGNIATLVEAENLLSKAIGVLKQYYEEALASAGSMLQKRASGKGEGKEEPAPPATWEGEYKGQNKESGAVGMVEFILAETKKEEQMAHAAEDEGQQSYEASMGELKKLEGELGDVLAKKQLELAENKEALLGKEEDLKSTEGVKEKIEAYLEKIKAGCDFIRDNLEFRKANRKEEKEALEKASGLLKGTPAYKAAMAAAHNETLGGCAAICAKGEEHAKCQACLEGISVPGYCAGHQDAVGC